MYKAIAKFESLGNYRDSRENLIFCKKRIEELKRLEDEKRVQEETKRRKAIKKKRTILFLALLACIIIFFVVFHIRKEALSKYQDKYNDALEIMGKGDYQEAIIAFEELHGYKDSTKLIGECKDRIYAEAVRLKNHEDYYSAINEFQYIGDYKDSLEICASCTTWLYEQSVADLLTEDLLNYWIKDDSLTELEKRFTLISDYEDSSQFLYMVDGINAFNDNRYDDSFNLFKKVDSDFISGYKEFYEKWYSLSIYGKIFYGEESIEDALEMYSLVPESHKEDYIETIEMFKRLQVCEGRYEIESVANSFKSFIEINYWIGNETINAEVASNALGDIQGQGTVVKEYNDGESYSFEISVNGTKFQVSPKEVKADGSVYKKSTQ